YEAARARRQYDAVEPENRLVVRTLERTWETALSELARLETEYETALRERPAAATQAEITAIRAVSEDLPATAGARVGRGYRRQRASARRMSLARRDPDGASNCSSGLVREAS